MRYQKIRNKHQGCHDEDDEHPPASSGVASRWARWIWLEDPHLVNNYSQKFKCIHPEILVTIYKMVVTWSFPWKMNMMLEDEKFRDDGGIDKGNGIAQGEAHTMGAKEGWPDKQ
jgi:hypothetical protein